MPSSISTWRWVGLPSSSMFSEPRRSTMVPSSITVTPLAATRWPRRALKAELPLRLKAPSSPWPTASCNNLPGRRRIGVEVGDRLVDGFLGIALEDFVVEIAEVETPAAPGTALLALAVFLNDDRYRATDQRPDVGGQPAVGTGDQNHLVFAGQRGHYLHHARVEGAGETFQALQQLDLGVGRQRGDRVVWHVERIGYGRRQKLPEFGILSERTDGPHGVGGVAERPRADVVGVGEGGLLAGQRAHADALVDVETARLDDALVQAPGLGARILEIEVGIVDLVRQDLAEGPRQVALGRRKRFQQQGFGLRQCAVRIHCNSIIVCGGQEPAGSGEFRRYGRDREQRCRR